MKDPRPTRSGEARPGVATGSSRARGDEVPLSGTTRPSAAAGAARTEVVRPSWLGAKDNKASLCARDEGLDLLDR